MTRQIHISGIDDNKYKKLKEGADARGLKVSVYARMILYEFLDGGSNGNNR